MMKWLRKKKPRKLYIDIKTKEGRLVINKSYYLPSGKEIFISENIINVHVMGYHFQYEAPEFLNKKPDLSQIQPAKCYKVVDGKIIKCKYEDLGV